MTPEKIKLSNGKLNVPENPIIPYIEGDGTGPDIWKASDFQEQLICLQSI